ncbi:hypothetical protein PybrP1_001412 [[Pythium] brassicae (nom. inval.)]|nr:hypothetical protein PybrP1_001412 [[Pythium] brassicae (nom. inval.)]
MIQGDDELRGIPVPDRDGEAVKVADFVDNTAMHLRRAQMTPRLLNHLIVFEELSGPKIQLKKSVFISLNTTVDQLEYQGIRMLKPGDATRYLSVQIGHTDMTDANWERRISSLKTRLSTAVQISTSVVSRIKILIAVVLPAILFTAQFNKGSAQTLQTLDSFWKQFVWDQKLSRTGRKHKVNPGLLFTPIRKGGLGLLSI